MLDVAELFKSGENELTVLKGDGDFRSPECLELLDEADIVVTNPPFGKKSSITLPTKREKWRMRIWYITVQSSGHPVPISS